MHLALSTDLFLCIQCTVRALCVAWRGRPPISLAACCLPFPAMGKKKPKPAPPPKAQGKDKKPTPTSAFDAAAEHWLFAAFNTD